MGLAYYNEIDAHAAQWLRNLIDAGLIAPGVVDERSIEDVIPSDLKGFTQCHWFAGLGGWSRALRLAGVSDDTPIWTASCPCQPFSAAGVSAGFADPRHLWPSLAWLVAQLKPGALFGEQVASKTVEPWVDLVQAHMEGMDYAFGAVAFPSSGVGAPHIRDRVYWVGYSNDAGSQGYREFEAARGRLGHGLRQPHGSTGSTSDVVGLANLHGDRRDQGREREPSAGDDGSQRDGTAGRMGDTDSQLNNGTEQRRPGGLAEHPDDGPTVGLANTECGNASVVEGQRPGPGEADRAGASGQPQGCREVHDPRPAGPVNGHWATADWLFCRDGKWRAVEPGTFPLADGAAGRVGKLRAYGNAINVSQASIFIETALSVPRCVFSDL